MCNFAHKKNLEVKSSDSNTPYCPSIVQIENIGIIKHARAQFIRIVFKNKRRSEGFLKIFEKYTLELTIVENCHARYLKENYPDSNLIYFRSDTFSEKLSHYGNVSSLFKKQPNSKLGS